MEDGMASTQIILVDGGSIVEIEDWKVADLVTSHIKQVRYWGRLLNILK